MSRDVLKTGTVIVVMKLYWTERVLKWCFFFICILPRRWSCVVVYIDVQTFWWWDRTIYSLESLKCKISTLFIWSYLTFWIIYVCVLIYWWLVADDDVFILAWNGTLESKALNITRCKDQYMIHTLAFYKQITEPCINL